MTEITQADRDAAAGWATKNSRKQQAANILRGSCDNAPLVQAFARHRIAALSAPREPSEAMIEAIVRGLGPYKMPFTKYEDYSGEHREWTEYLDVPRGCAFFQQVTRDIFTAYQTMIAAKETE